MENKKNVLWKLFISTLYLSAFTFGGGYVIVTLMKKKFVDDYHWIEENKLAGMPGVLVAIIGTIIPPFLIISVISVCYNAFRSNYFVSQMLEGMQAGVGAVIASVTYEMGADIVQDKNGISTVIMVGAFIASCIFEVNVVYVVIVCGLIGVIRTCIAKRRKNK